YRSQTAVAPIPTPGVHHCTSLQSENKLFTTALSNSHILPLRRFLENCLGTDLRSFFAESCFKFALTSQHVPPFCRGGYLEQRGESLHTRLRVPCLAPIPGNSRVWNGMRSLSLSPWSDAPRFPNSGQY
uniref:Uncharacterized protein n=1 Tax=Callorhinchus milii TaxID=7868 RepID=A0A4W3JPE7_CALMI